MPGHRVLEGDAVGPEHRPRRAGDVERGAHVGPLRQRDLYRVRTSGVLEPAEAVGDQPPLHQRGRHLRELLLNELARCDRTAEGGALPAVLERRLEAGARRAEGAPRDPVAGLVEAGQRPAQAGHVGEHGAVRKADVVEGQLRGHRRAQ